MTAAQYIKRFESLSTKRSQLERLWKESYNYTYPLRGQKFSSGSVLTSGDIISSAASQQAAIYDTTAIDAVRLLASAMISGLTPANSRWFGQEAPNLKNNDDVKKWLDSAADAVWKNIHASNYDVVAFEAFIDYAIAGIFAVYIEKGGESLYNFQLWPMANCYCADSTGKGMIDTVYRNFSLTAEQAIKEYGKENLSKQIIDTAAKTPDTTFEFLQVIEPRPEKKQSKLKLPIASVHLEVAQKKIIRELGYHEMPVVIPRWMVIPDSVYSVGPVYDALPDIKTINEVVKYVLANADMAIAGMWGAVDDGVLNPKTVKVGARKIIPMAGKDNFFPLTSGAKFDVAAIEIDRLQKSIRKILMADQLQPQDGPKMTAYEVHVRVQLIRQMLGPTYGRLQSEFLQPLVERCFGIAMRTGVLTEPPLALKQAAKGGFFNTVVKYCSPLARAQKLEDVKAMDAYEANIMAQAGAGKTDVIDNYDFDKAARKRADFLGVPSDLIPNLEDVKATREQRAKDIEAAQAKQAQAEQAKAMAPKLAEGMAKT